MSMTTTDRQERTTSDLVIEVDRPIPVTRRRIDHLLVGAGAVVAAVLVVAAGLLTWGSNFAQDYVGDELSAQAITFPNAATLTEEGRTDLLGFAGEQLTTGDGAEAYASYIGGHLEDVADGMTYAELGGPARAASAAASEAEANGAPADEVASLQAEAAALNGQRDTLFKGEMLRGTLLNAFAWSTIGRIAGIAATVAFVGAAVMALLAAAGVVHLRRTATHAA